MSALFSEEVSNVRLRALVHVPVLLLCCGVVELFAVDEPPGIPVTSDLVKNACGGCHEQDDKGRMTRISFERKTPEGWELTMKRMVRTGRVQLSPDQAKEVVRYLADNHGLAPAEARAVFYRAEKRPHLEDAVSEEVGETCNRCHLAAWYLSERRTKEEWHLLKGMHIGYFPIIEYQTFRGPAPGERGSDDAPRAAGASAPTAPTAPTDDRWRVDRVLDYLSEHYGFDTSDWKEFEAKKSRVDLSGRWLLTTHQPTKGLASGTVVFEKAPDGYRTRAELRLANGTTDKRTGTGFLYSDFTWRGRSVGQGLEDRREVLQLSDDESELTGRFFRGEYGELGLDVRLVRLGSDPRIGGVSPRALSAPGTGALAIVGANLPTTLAPGDIDLGPGAQVTRIRSQAADRVELDVEVSADAPPGRRNVRLGPTTTAVDAFAVYDKIDYVKVVPEEGLARLGGGAIPKQFIQFEAIAFASGPDGQPLTADDVELNVVAPQWSLEEYHVRPEDDDLQYVGAIDGNGFFTPNIDGPNPNRKRGTNNMGDVWVVASYAAPGASRPLLGRSQLIVSPPIYTYWDFKEAFP
jgi:quinohemoprotein amine dehydrogenase